MSNLLLQFKNIICFATKYFGDLNARVVEGTNLPASIAIMVCLAAFTFSASSACVKLSRAGLLLLNFHSL